MDIRLVRGRRSRVWLWAGLLAGGGVLLLVVTMVFGGDQTMRAKNEVGADANFGAGRSAVLPMEAEPFEAILPLDGREVGRLLHLRASVESPLRGGAVWVRTTTGRRMLVRFEPLPGDLRLGPGSSLAVNGYLQKLSRAELDLWTDTLGVVIPRPRPGAKFGDVPDASFAQIDSLFVRDYFLLVRPEGLRDTRSTADLRPDAPPAADTAASR
jgi:hypothetical protein